MVEVVVSGSAWSATLYFARCSKCHLESKMHVDEIDAHKAKVMHMLPGACEVRKLESRKWNGIAKAEVIYIDM